MKRMATLSLPVLMAVSVYAQDAATASDEPAATNYEVAAAEIVGSETAAKAALLNPALVGETYETTMAMATYKRKQPALAWFLSYLYPGIGQFYNGQNGKGAAMVVAGTVGLGCMIGGIATTDEDSYEMTPEGGATFALGLVVYLAASIWSQIDAPISAVSINRRNASLSWNTGKGSELSLRPNLYYASTGMGTKKEPVCGVALRIGF